MAWKDEKKNLIVEFLRHRLTDPRERGETASFDTFSGTGAAQTLTLTPTSGSKVWCITSVIVGGVAINKWQDYTIDLQNQQVLGTFTSGTDNVVVNYKEGIKNWIFDNFARETLSTTSYPRINVLLISSPAKRLGNYLAELESIEHYQIDIWVKENYIYDAGTNTYSNDKLAMYFAREIVKQLEDNIDDLYPELHDLTILNVRDAVWEKTPERFHAIVEVELSGDSIGG